MKRWRTIGLCLLLAASGASTAQQRVVLPLNGDSAEVSFTYRPVSAVSASGQGIIEPAGKVILPGPGAIGIRFSDLDVTGFSSLDSTILTLQFPGELPVDGDGTLTLSRRSRATALVLNITDSETLEQPVAVKVSSPRFSASTSFVFTQAVVIVDSTGVAGKSEQVDSAVVAKEDKITLTRNEPPVVSKTVPTFEQTAEEAGEIAAESPPVVTMPPKAPIAKSPDRSDRPMTYTHAQQGTVHTFIFSDVDALEVVDVSTAVGISIVEDTVVDPARHRLVLNSSVPGFHRVEVIDRTKNLAYQRLGVHLDSRLGGTLEETDEAVVFTDLTGGTPPYKLAFYRGRDYIATLEDVAPTGLTIAKADLLGYQPEGGAISVRMVDVNNAGEFFFDGQTVSLATAEPSGGWITAWYGLAVLSVLGLIYLAFKNRDRDRKRGHLNKVRQEMREDDSPAPSRHPADTEIGAPLPPTAREVEAREASDLAGPITGNAPPYDEPGSASLEAGTNQTGEAPEPIRKATMRISRRTEPSEQNTKPFAPDEPGARHLTLPMNRHWASSMITELYLGAEAVERLDEFLHRENVDKIVATGSERERLGWERNESVPEIGGMLMGQFKRVKGALTYRVSIEKFVPLEAKYQSVTKVEIDPMSLARDLGDAQDENPDLIVVGWFHTHPGHGLFLSRPDLEIHYSHFYRPYHLAMEIDSLSERLDTGFFTYLPSGHMNNSATLRPDTSWFSWAKIRQQHR